MDPLALALVALRTAGLYLGLLVAMRFIGKRKVGQMAPSDIVMLLLVGDAAQNAMTGGDQTFLGSVVAVISLLLTDHAVGALSYHFPFIERFFEGRPLVMFRRGAFDDRVLRREKITRQDLATALRAHGCDTLAGVREIVLEPNGMVSLLKEGPQAADSELDPQPRPPL